MEDLIQQIEERLRNGDKASASRLLQELAAVHGAVRAREAVSRLKHKWAADVAGTEPSSSREMSWLFWLFGFCTCCPWGRSHSEYMSRWIRRAVSRIKRKWAMGIEGAASPGPYRKSWFVWLLGLCTCWMRGRSFLAWISGWFWRRDEWDKTIDDLCVQWEKKRAAVENRLPSEEAEESRDTSVPLDVPRGDGGRGATATGQSDAAQSAATEAGKGEGSEPVVAAFETRAQEEDEADPEAASCGMPGEETTEALPRKP